MRAYRLEHLSDRDLLRALATLVARERATTAMLLAHIAEVDARRLYLPAGFPSMYSYCVHELRLSEDAAYKRIQAARAARQFPALFGALAEGRLHLTGLGLLAPHLTPKNAQELLKAAAGKTKAEIEELLARRFPRTEMLPLVQALPTSRPARSGQLAPAQVEHTMTGRATALPDRLAPAQVSAPAPPSKVTPVAAEPFALQVTIGRGTHEKLRYAQALLSHQIPSRDAAQVLDRALDALIGQLEKQKFAATPKPRPRPRRSTNTRYVPAHVKRAVWERDQGRCTFVGESGRRCPARSDCGPCACGCRGAGQGMECLRELGFRTGEARRAAGFCMTLTDATLEERVRAALKFSCPETRSHGPIRKKSGGARIARPIQESSKRVFRRPVVPRPRGRPITELPRRPG